MSFGDDESCCCTEHNQSVFLLIHDDSAVGEPASPFLVGIYETQWHLDDALKQLLIDALSEEDYEGQISVREHYRVKEVTLNSTSLFGEEL